MTVKVTHITHYLVNPPLPSLNEQGDPKIQVTHQPEYYDHILYYVQKGVQIT